jgi:hypothetical protein
MSHQRTVSVEVHAPRSRTVDDYREAIVKRRGGPSLASLALAITAARICPAVNETFGHGKACTRGGGTPVMFDHGQVAALVAMRTAWAP